MCAGTSVHGQTFPHALCEVLHTLHREEIDKGLSPVAIQYVDLLDCF